MSDPLRHVRKLKCVTDPDLYFSLFREVLEIFATEYLDADGDISLRIRGQEERLSCPPDDDAGLALIEGLAAMGEAEDAAAAGNVMLAMSYTVVMERSLRGYSNLAMHGAIDVGDLKKQISKKQSTRASKPPPDEVLEHARRARQRSNGKLKIRPACERARKHFLEVHPRLPKAETLAKYYKAKWPDEA